jgi:hypothetical protein
MTAFNRLTSTVLTPKGIVAILKAATGLAIALSFVARREVTQAVQK